MQSLVKKAKEILIANDNEGKYTIPSSLLYPHLWAWDSAFAAIGWSTFDMKRACAEQEFLLNTSWEDGKIPHIYFNEKVKGQYFPGPNEWRNQLSSTITQPPAWGISLEVLLDRGADLNWIEKMIPKVEKSHRFFYEKRDPLKKNIVAIAHPWESGMDNCPAWDKAMHAIDTVTCPPFERVDIHKIGDPRERPSDEEYKVYMTIVKSIAENGFEMGCFSVYDPMMTSMLALSEYSLAKVCEKVGVNSDAKFRYKILCDSLEKELWDKNHEQFKYYDSNQKLNILEPTLGSFFPLLLPGFNETIKDKLRPKFEKFFCSEKYHLSTFDPTHKKYQPLCYWRGPVWINTNWLFGMYYDKKFFAPIAELCQKSGFREYFDPRSGEGLGATDFTWAAALYLDLVERKLIK